MIIQPLHSFPHDNLEQLVALERRVWEAADHYDKEPWALGNFARELPEKSRLSAAMVESGRIVAFLVASRRSDESVHIHRLAVEPTKQGQGIGGALLGWLLERTRSPLTVNCDDQSSAVHLYSRLGFERIGRNDDDKMLLHLGRRPERLRVWYVVEASGMIAGHAAHVPRLVAAMNEEDCAEVVAYGSQTGLPSFRLRISWFLSFVRLLKRAQDQQVDVMFVRIVWPIAALLRVAAPFYGRWLVALWSSGGVGWEPCSRRSVRNRCRDLLFRTVLRHFVDVVVTGPPSLVGEYKNRYALDPHRVVLASNDVEMMSWADFGNTEAFSDLERSWLSQPHRFIFVHTLDRLRGADRLPQLKQRIDELLPGSAILVVGDGSERPALANRGLVMIGAVSNARVAGLIAHAHCLLLPSRQEGFPRVVLEAMALGVPPVAFDVGGCREIAGPLAAQLIVTPDDLDAMAHRACLLAVDRDLRPALRRRALAFDSSVVGRRLCVSLGFLVSHGPALAARLSRALWLPTFAGSGST